MQLEKLIEKISREAKPCPFCGSTEIYAGPHDAFSFVVGCKVCKSQGTVFPLPDKSKLSLDDLECELLQKAAGAWNKRPGGRSALMGFSGDPVTNGHVWMMQQASKLFDKLWVVIAVNPSKKTTFSAEERILMVEGVREEFNLPNILIDMIGADFLVRFALHHKIDVLIRGIRDENDFRYERAMRHVNASLAPTIDTMFLMPPQNLEFVSSSFVKGMVGLRGWESEVEKYVPKCVFTWILRKERK